MPLDKLLGEERPHGQTPLELATVADMAMEIGSRERGQPAILIYDHGDGRWPVRMGPGVTSDTLRKMASILLSVAEQHRDAMGGHCQGDPTFKTPWGILRRVSNWSQKRDSLLLERQFEVLGANHPQFDGADSLTGEWRWLPFVVGWALGLASAAVVRVVFNLWG